MIEVNGAMLVAFWAAGKSIHFLLQDRMAAGMTWDTEQWYDVSELRALLEHSSRYSNPAAVLERLGEEMTQAWYAFGPGMQIAPTALEFIRFQAGSQGYRSLVRGEPSEIGNFELLDIDQAGGIATVRSSTIFERDMELGILNGGLNACNDLLYFDVAMREDRRHFDIRFVSGDNRETLGWAEPQPESEWRLRHQIQQFQRRERFWVSINDTLHEAMAELKATQQQLILQEKMASIGTLTAGVAHEINNPTNFAHAGAQTMDAKLEQFHRFLLEIAGDDADPRVLATLNERFGELHGQLATIIEGTSRIRDLVRDLRTFSRLGEADKKHVAIGDSLNSTINLVRTQYAGSAQITCQLDANPVLDCWPAQLNQVFMNLTVNACQAIERKQRERQDKALGHLQISSRMERERLVLEFRDDGCGMSEAVAKRIFEPFFTTKAEGEGTGLGLSISFGIIKRHQGSIRVLSVEGVGSTFTIELPCTSLQAQVDG
ncbi:sensor histidine kinase [Pseudoduganella sp. OTU4001]|uniref:sensor histidine kinase n=1 Tax=Pseudoduganella sp. OTU4001 TaxID=3043854 RepID=UPI00313B7131